MAVHGMRLIAWMYLFRAITWLMTGRHGSPLDFPRSAPWEQPVLGIAAAVAIATLVTWGTWNAVGYLRDQRDLREERHENEAAKLREAGQYMRRLGEISEFLDRHAAPRWIRPGPVAGCWFIGDVPVWTPGEAAVAFRKVRAADERRIAMHYHSASDERITEGVFLGSEIVTACDRLDCTEPHDRFCPCFRCGLDRAEGRAWR